MSITWTSERRKICDLKLAEYNPRQATEKEVQDLTTSIERFDLADPIIINKDNQVIGGHFRIRILKDKGIMEADVRVPDVQLTQEQEKELNLRLNKNLGEWDLDALANFDEKMLKDVGFESAELDKIFQLDTPKDPDTVPDVTEVGVKVGDLYKLGSHRLLCGDSTQKEAVDRLMDGNKADMVFTDPPYNVNMGTIKHPKFKQRTIKNDNMGGEEWFVFCNRFIENLKNNCKGDFYICHAPLNDGHLMINWLIAKGFHWATTIIWTKDVFTLGRGKYQNKYEPIFYGWIDKSSFCNVRTEANVWEFDRPKRSKLHPTMKPIELIERAILNSSERGNIILDLFGGSGSTMIACERLNRKCYMMEIDPKYCQVIIDRWEQYTNLKAIKEEYCNV